MNLAHEKRCLFTRPGVAWPGYTDGTHLLELREALVKLSIQGCQLIKERPVPLQNPYENMSQRIVEQHAIVQRLRMDPAVLSLE